MLCLKLLDPGYPKRPRRATANYSTNYYAPIAGFDEPDYPSYPSHVVHGNSGDDEEQEPLPQRKRARTKKSSAEVSDLTDAEFAEEWGQFLAPELEEHRIDDDDSDSEYEETSVGHEEQDTVQDEDSRTEPFLPEFFDQTAKLDKDYPSLQSFLSDNKSAIEDFEIIVTSACWFIHNFTKTLDFKKYFSLPPDEQAISMVWASFMGHSNPEIVSRTCLKAVPAQTAAAFGRSDCTVQDIDRLPHFPSSGNLFGGYVDHVHKV
ncbi:hypothetical protein Daus18300_012067 [Diaporthe australafricana]|uniref:Uncharacterized protein n=1 Tax=Diaporthe australafricana TaxID=127596 RepID=A0ABR3W453_9PEZI